MSVPSDRKKHACTPSPCHGELPPWRVTPMLTGSLLLVATPPKRIKLSTTPSSTEMTPSDGRPLAASQKGKRGHKGQDFNDIPTVDTQSDGQPLATIGRNKRGTHTSQMASHRRPLGKINGGANTGRSRKSPAWTSANLPNALTSVWRWLLTQHPGCSLFPTASTLMWLQPCRRT